MNLSYVTTSRKFRISVIVFMLVFIGANVFGQKNIYKAPGIVYNNTKITDVSLVKTYADPEILVPNHVSLNAKTYVKLKVSSEIGPFVWTKSAINITMIPFLPNGTEDPALANRITKILEVEYNPNGNSANYVDLSTYELVNRYGVRVVVNSTSSTIVPTGEVNSTNLNSNVSLEIGFEAERYYQITEQLPALQTTFLIDDVSQPVALQFNWTTLTGALEYELEWTWVDNYSTNTTVSLLPNQIKFSSRDFELNNTRIRTANLNYEIPLIYSSGYIIYRVRGVGRFIDLADVSKIYYGPWSSGLSIKYTVADWTDSYISIAEHDKQKNWQFQASYAEQGKKKEVVSYFDGSLRNRQTVTKVNTDNNAVVGEVIYDAQGRAGIEILPVPINKNYIKYFKELNRNMSDMPYSHLDFDWQNLEVTGCATPISGMSLNYGSSNYYSSSNNINSFFRSYIPDAKLYPFSQIEYTPDNTGRITRKGGVGLTHQLDKGHEMQYFYSTPNQEELNRLFGYQVGFATHYKKNTVVDPNGQVSVSYLDPQGRTIATALAGGQPTESINGSQVNLLDPLLDTSETSLHKKIDTDLLNKVKVSDTNTILDNNELSTSYNFLNYEDKLTLSKQIGVAGNNMQHTFSYNFENKNVFFAKNVVNRICDDSYSFVYDLTLSFKDKCLEEKFNSPLIQNYKLGKFGIGPDAVGYNENLIIGPSPLNLNTGNYSLLKELKVNKDVLNSYADHYMLKFSDKRSGCFISPNSFAPSVNIDCNTSCDDCKTNVGTQSEYILKQLKGIYNIPATNTSITIHPTTFEIGGTLPSGSTINLGQPISILEANGFVTKFKAEWLPLKAACDYICGTTFASGCGINERSLLTDVSPKGQYFLINYPTENNSNPVQDGASLYNESNQIIYQNQINTNNWRNPVTPYLNDMGQPALVQVVQDATITSPISFLPPVTVTPTTDPITGLQFVSPQNLANRDDFVSKWKDSWAKSLLPYHPEYCYLEYSRKVCEKIKPFNVNTYGGLNNAVLISTILDKPLTSDEYDGYLNYLDTYKKAENSGFLNLATSYPTNINDISIFANDPYFSTQLSGAFETATLFSLRKSIMESALTNHYEFNLLDNNPAKLFQVAVQIVKCNALEPCSYTTITNNGTFSNWTEAEKDRLWNTYKSLYISFKSKIKHVFINTYAKLNGCYNGCIGTSNNAKITDVLENYPAQIASIDAIIEAATATQFCANTNASVYRAKEKRFVPIDISYDSGNTDQGAVIAQLTTQGNYSFYTQTGNCPMINDLNIFLQEYFKNINLSTTTINLNNPTQPIGQTVTAKLFTGLTGNSVPLASGTPTMQTAISNGSLSFVFSPAVSPGTPAQLKLEIPASANLSWDNYGILGINKWSIISLSQLYYDQATSTLTPGNVSFGYKVIAKIKINTGSDPIIKEVVLFGNTIAKIGECFIQGQGPANTYGEAIVTNDVACCPEKGDFASALKDLMVHLQNIGQINANYVITNDTVFTSGFLHSFLNISVNDVVRTEFTSSSFKLFVNNIIKVYIANFNSGSTQPDFNMGALQSLNIGNIVYDSSSPYNGQSVGNILELSFRTPSGVVTLNTFISTQDPVTGLKNNLFTCDSPCGDSDSNGNGIGDLCDIAQCPQKVAFGNALKDLINHLQNIGQIQNNYNITNDSVFTSGYLHQYFGISPNDVVVWYWNGPYYTIKINGWYRFGMQINENNFLENNRLATIEIGNLLNPGGGAPGHIITGLTEGRNSPYQGFIMAERAVGKANLYFNCDTPQCGEWDHNNTGVGDLCESSEHNNIIACSIAADKERTYENNLKNILNEYLKPQYFVNNSTTAQVYIPYTLTSSNVLFSQFVNESNLLELFQDQRNKSLYNGVSYTVPVSAIYTTFIAKSFSDPASINDGYVNITFTSHNSNFNIDDYSEVYIRGFNTSDISRINYIDITDNVHLTIDYIDRTGVNKRVENILFTNFTRYTAAGSIGSNFCPFLTKTLGQTNTNSNRETNKEYNLKNLDQFQVKSNVFNTPQPCTPCIPPTVAPIACDVAAYQAYLNIFQFNPNGSSPRIDNVTKQNIVQQDRFCASSLQYVVASYENYITSLAITSTFDPNYLTILQFGDTNLNYGFSGINSAIQAYTTYNGGFPPVIIGETENTTPRLYWQEYINTIFFKSINGCPPKPMPVYSQPLPEIKTPCAEWGTNISAAYALNSYNAYLYQLRQDFIRDYISAAMSNVIENFTMTYDDKEYQYTLYYYDQAGNLIQTVAPEGVKRLSAISAVPTPPTPAISMLEINNAINNLRFSPPVTDVTFSGAIPVLPLHTYKTEYKYNTLNQLVWQSTPDGGIARFAYDVLGRIIASQNSKQLNTTLEPNLKRFSYTEYDFLGRITEAGEIHVPLSSGLTITDDGKLFQNAIVQNNFAGSYSKTEVTRTVYSQDPVVENTVPPLLASGLFTTNAATGFNASHNNRNRVTAVYYHDIYTSKFTFDNAIFYNYDVHGNVKELVNYNSYLKNLGCTPTTVINASTGQQNDCEKHLKRVVYNYDLISGNVNKVTFQPNKFDQFSHRYNYDADNRIVNVETSPDGVNWEKDANYQYYPHGPLARVELGDKNVQGQDYAYTLQGWLKTVNGENITDSTNDIGNDGLLASKRKTKDAYGYSLSYYDKDYKAIAGDDAEDASFKPLMFSRNNTVAGSIKNLYNGNIKQMTTAIRTNQNTVLPVQKNNYTYDQLNRIKGMTSSAIIPGTSGMTSSSDSYGSAYSYDRNGNLQTMTNTAPGVYAGITNPTMDNFTYKYAAGNNKLNKVFDSADDLFPITQAKDIRKNSAELGSYVQNDTATHNYIYDEIGQLIQDKSEGLQIFWRVDGKVKNVIKTIGRISQNIIFEYDGLGNRIAKKQIADINTPTSVKTTYYSRDAQGNVLAVYDLMESTARDIQTSSLFQTTSLILKEHHLFGSSRLGLESKNMLVYQFSTMNNEMEMKGGKQKTLLPITDVSTSLLKPLSLTPFYVYNDYSLRFEPTTVATWPMLSQTPTTGVSNPELNNFSFGTKIKLLNPTSLPNGEFSVAQLKFMGTKNVLSFTPVILNNWTVTSENQPTVPACISFDNDGDETIRDINKDCIGYIPTTRFTRENVILANQIGYVSYQLSNIPSHSHDVGVTLKIGVDFYTFFTQSSQGNNVSVITTDDNEGPSQATFVPPGSVLKIQRNVDNITFSANGQILRTIPINLFNLPVHLSAVFGITGNTTVRSIQRINNLSVYRSQLATKEISNEINFSVIKSSLGYTPKTSIAQYLRDPATNITTLRTYNFVSSNIVNNSQIANGLEVNLNTSFANNTGNFLLNGINQNINPVWTENGIVSNPGSFIPSGRNQIGGAFAGLQAASFDMCYFNYDIGSSPGSDYFTFDDVVSPTITNNAPKATQNPATQITMTPNVVRVLGPCLFDKDQDGLYDIYEDINSDTNLANDDTDKDGKPNYDDSDDDGDGIETKYESADPDGDHNPDPFPVPNPTPYTGIAPLNTNNFYDVLNPKRIINTIPNYLDIDDDGDGYATWETYEGGPGIKNTPTPGLPYTQNTDSDLPVDYLDYSSQLYQPALAFSFSNYLNIVGDKRYELSNHLGNVLVVINDKKIPFIHPRSGVLLHYNADIVSYSDYYPFGMLVPNRHGSTPAYRYGFQGQEKDDEIKGEGNSLNYTYRMHDPRIGRFFATDPLESKYAYLTPFQFASNNPIGMIELEGLEGVVASGLPAPFTNNSRPTGVVLTTQQGLEVAKATSTALVKLGFKHYLPKKLIDHYTESNGRTLFLNNKEIVDSHMKAISIMKGYNSDVKVREQEETNFMNEFNGLNPGESKNILLNVSTKAGTHGTLGHCTAIFNGLLTKDKDGENWTFNGVMQFYDYWNFDEKKAGERTKQGESATAIGRALLIGEGFKIYSPIYKVSETSKDEEVNWFKDIDSSDLNTKTKTGQSIINTTKDYE